MNTMIEGVDYLVDRYAVLGVPEDASHEAIRKAVREHRAQNHPDRLGGASDAIKKVADQQRAIINQAAEVLLEPDLRAGYDARLAEFRQKWPQSISDNGNIIHDLIKPRVDLDSLLRADEDLSDIGFLAKAEQLTGHNPKQLALLNRMLEASPDDADLKAATRAARIVHWTHCTVLEHFAWARAGIQAGESDVRATANPFEVVERVNERIEYWANTVVPETLALRQGAVALRLAPPLRLLGHDGQEPAAAHDDALPALVDAEVLSRVQAALRARTQSVKEAAEQTQAALTAALALTPFEVLCRTEGAPLDIVWALGDLASSASATPVIAFRFENSNLSESPLGAHATVGDWRTQALSGTVVLVEHHPELTPMLAEVWWLADQAEALGLIEVPSDEPAA